MSILISLLVYCIVFGLLWYLVDMLPLPAPVRTIVTVIFILIMIVALLSFAGILPGAHFPLVRL